jgi:hypothetical protein
MIRGYAQVGNTILMEYYFSHMRKCYIKKIALLALQGAYRSGDDKTIQKVKNLLSEKTGYTLSINDTVFSTAVLFSGCELTDFHNLHYDITLKSVLYGKNLSDISQFARNCENEYNTFRILIEHALNHHDNDMFKLALDFGINIDIKFILYKEAILANRYDIITIYPYTDMSNAEYNYFISLSIYFEHFECFEFLLNNYKQKIGFATIEVCKEAYFVFKDILKNATHPDSSGINFIRK